MSLCALVQANLLVRLAGFAIALGGCSALSSRPPSRRPLLYPEECSDSRWPVVGDVYLAVNTGSVALLFATAAGIEYAHNTTTVVPSWDQHRLSVDKGLLIGGALSVAATVALIRSARYGLESARACDDARLEPFRPGLSPPFSQPSPPWPSR